jgi:hypothetical protein
MALVASLVPAWAGAIVPTPGCEPELVSVSSSAMQAPNVSTDPDMTPDGRFLAFTSRDEHLVANDGNALHDVFLRDRLTGTTTLVSVGVGGSSANGASAMPAVTPDGRYVAFRSEASNLVPGDTNGAADAFGFVNRDWPHRAHLIWPHP